MNGLFSERYGYVVKLLQYESLSQRVRQFLLDEVNTYYLLDAKGKFNRDFETKSPAEEDLWEKNAISFYFNMWRTFLGRSVHDFNESAAMVNSRISSEIMSKVWYQCFDAIEAVVRLSTLLYPNKKEYRNTLNQFSSAINEVFQEEKCSYGMVDGLIIPVTNNVEIITITDALTNSTSIQSVNTHLVQAVKLYSNRKNPDYRNAIKEAISALESLLKLITGTPKGTMADALKLIKTNGTIELHPALQDSLKSLYGWAGDAPGIRHAIKEGSPPIDIEDAKLIIVTCCSFVSYLMAKAIKSGIDLASK